MTMHINREEDADQGLAEWLEKLPVSERVPSGDYFQDLYFEVYPTHVGREYELFLVAYGMKYANNRRREALAFLSGKLWEKLSGDSLA